MRIVHYYPTARVGSGVTIALWSWARALAHAGVPVAVLHAGDRPSDKHVLDDPAGDSRLIEEHIVPHRGRGRTTTFPVGLRRYLRRGDVLVLHEGWTISHQVAAHEARRARIPYLVMAHGVYEHAWREYLKRPRRLREIVEQYLLERALAVHLFFASEASDVLVLAPRASWIAVPTGVAVADDLWIGGGGYISWVGRMDPFNKGLDLLVEAVELLPPEHRPRVALHGYDYRGGTAALRALVTSRHLEDWFEIGGVVSGREKTRFMQHADACVHPSRWESYGLALMENLALGAPCLVSTGVHVAAELQRRGAAVVVAPTADAIAGGLLRLPEEGPMIGARGRRYVKECLSWNAIVPGYLNSLRRLGVV